MNSTARIKFVIAVALLIAVALCSVVVIQLVNISKIKKEINAQQYQIQQLEKELDQNNKTPNTDYDSITGE